MTANHKKLLNTKHDVSFGLDTCSLRTVTVMSLKWLYTTVIKNALLLVSTYALIMLEFSVMVLVMLAQ